MDDAPDTGMENAQLVYSLLGRQTEDGMLADAEAIQAANAIEALERTPKLTYSLDACIRLMKEVLPGWRRKVTETSLTDLKPRFTVRLRWWEKDFSGSHDEETRSLPIAILQAVGEA